jgi:uncharacterized membrane protein (TIGR02234 family)
MTEQRRRRELVIGLSLLVAGGVMGLVAMNLSWGEAYLGDGTTLPVRGRDVAPLYLAPPLFALAASVAVVATRRAGRLLIGVTLAVMAIVGASLSIVAGIAMADRIRDWAPDAGYQTAGAAGGSSNMMWYPVACAVILLAGVFIAVLGPKWPSLGARYDRTPATGPLRRNPTARDAWDALDRGDDPTT